MLQSLEALGGRETQRLLELSAVDSGRQSVELPPQSSRVEPAHV